MNNLNNNGLFENIRDGKVVPSIIVYKDEYVTAFEIF